MNAQVGGRGSMIAQDGEIARASGAMYGMMPHVASDRMGFSAFGDSAHDSSLPFNNPDPYYLDNAEAMQDVSASGRDAYQPAGAVCGELSWPLCDTVFGTDTYLFFFFFL